MGSLVKARLKIVLPLGFGDRKRPPRGVGWMGGHRYLLKSKSLKIIPLKGVEVAHTVGLVAPYREPHTPVLGTLLREAKQMSAA